MGSVLFRERLDAKMLVREYDFTVLGDATAVGDLHQLPKTV